MGIIIIIPMLKLMSSVRLSVENRYNNYYPNRFCLKEGIIELSIS